ncbi:MAG: hypothetical protein ACK5EH_21525 [Pseudanabaena sp.]
MQTLSPTISPTISRTYNPRGTDAETDFLPAIAQSSVLQTALAGLDASLNDELDRYRHWQDNGQTISYLNPFRPRAVSTQSIWTSPSLSDALSPIAPITDSTTSDRRTIQMPVMPPMGAGLPANSSINISAAELHNFKGLESLQSLESFSGRGFEQDSPYAQDMNGYGESSSMASPTMARVPEPDDDEILQSFANDYADSYQQPIEQESAYPIPSAPNEKSALRSLMNPVGIISLLLLLCSSAAIGYLMVDPSGVMKLFKPESKQKSSQNDVKNSDLGSDINLQNQQQKSNDAGLSFVPFAGDKNTLTNSNKSLANSAIAPKNPLNNPSSKSSSLFAPNSAFVPSTPLRIVPSTALPPISVAPLPPALAPAPAERTYSPPSRNYDSAPAPSYNPPSPRPSTSRANSSPSPARSTPPNSTSPTDNPAPTTVYVTPRSNTAVKYAAPLSSAPAAPAPSSSYRVVVENSYAASAQQIERDAYVRPSDGQVQVGSYRDANAAQQRIEQLRRQGIPARIE